MLFCFGISWRGEYVGDCWLFVCIFEFNSWIVLVLLYYNCIMRDLESWMMCVYYVINWVRYVFVWMKLCVEVV